MSAADAGERAGRALGAKLVALEVIGGNVLFEFEHRGTDDDSGCLLVPLTAIRFCDDDQKCEKCIHLGASR